MFGWFKKKITVVTHDGDFHPDEVFACAAFSMWADKHNYKLKIIRTREKSVLDKADVVIDVGMQYNPDKNRFDHHQKEGAGNRSGIPYASFGLVWERYGQEICDDNEVADEVEKKLVILIDATDNGINLNTASGGIHEYSIIDVISNMNPTLEENSMSYDGRFRLALDLAKNVLEREIIWTAAEIMDKHKTLQIIEKQFTVFW